MACRMYFHRWTPGKMDGMKDNIIDCQMARWLTPLNEVNKLQFGKVKRKKKERKSFDSKCHSKVLGCPRYIQTKWFGSLIVKL